MFQFASVVEKTRVHQDILQINHKWKKKDRGICGILLYIWAKAMWYYMLCKQSPILYTRCTDHKVNLPLERLANKSPCRPKFLNSFKMSPLSMFLKSLDRVIMCECVIFRVRDSLSTACMGVLIWQYLYIYMCYACIHAISWYTICWSI